MLNIWTEILSDMSTAARSLSSEEIPIAETSLLPFGSLFEPITSAVTEFQI
jgi:hypothetical protein